MSECGFPLTILQLASVACIQTSAVGTAYNIDLDRIQLFTCHVPSYKAGLYSMYWNFCLRNVLLKPRLFLSLPRLVDHTNFASCVPLW